MSKGAKIWLIAAGALILFGGLIFVVTMSILKWDFKGLSTEKCETNYYEITDPFTSIDIDTETSDVYLVPSEDGKCSVECVEMKNLKHTASVKDGKLKIKLNDTRKWYEHIGIVFSSTKITLSIPKGEYERLTANGSTGDVNIPSELSFESIDVTSSTGNININSSASGKITARATTGSVSLEGLSASSVDVSVSTGDVSILGANVRGDISIEVSTGRTRISDTSAGSITTEGSTGDLSLNKVVSTGRLLIERSTGDVSLDNTVAADIDITTDTGDVKFDRSDATEIKVRTDTGSVLGNLLSDKIFFARSDTGRIDVPKTTVGGRCDIETDKGNIIITVAGK